jgi:hypothetical protein
MSGFDIVTQVYGEAEAQRFLERAIEEMPELVTGALYREAEGVMTASEPLVPKDLGPLSRSGYVEILDGGRDGQGRFQRGGDGDPAVAVGYGGTSVEYAAVQHEREDYQHTAGQQAKYLEEPLLAALPGMPERIAKDVKFGLERL